MLITAYHRSYSVADAPVVLDLVPYSADPRHTYTAGKLLRQVEFTRRPPVATAGTVPTSRANHW